MDFGLNPKLVREIQEVFSEYSSIEKAMIFGSRALGNYRNNSDIDIVLYGVVSDKVLRQINGKCEALATPYLFDIVVYDSIQHQALKEHIDQYAKLIYDKEIFKSNKPLSS